MERIRRGTKEAFRISTVFSLVISALVFGFARPLMGIFIDSSETAVIGKIGIWMAIPIGWGLADAAGLWLMHRQK